MGQHCSTKRHQEIKKKQEQRKKRTKKNKIYMHFFDALNNISYLVRSSISKNKKIIFFFTFYMYHIFYDKLDLEVNEGHEAKVAPQQASHDCPTTWRSKWNGSDQSFESLSPQQCCSILLADVSFSIFRAAPLCSLNHHQHHHHDDLHDTKDLHACVGVDA